MTTLDEIRADIVAREHKARRDLAAADVELLAHDRAVKAMGDLAPAAPQPKPRAQRRNIAELVLDHLTAEPQTVAEIASATGIAPHQVLDRLGKELLAIRTDNARWHR